MEFREVLETRRAVNHFDPNKKLSDETLKEIIDLAVLAPSAFNLQPWRVLAVKSNSAKEKLLKLSNNQPKIMDAAVCLVIIGDRKGFRDENSVWADLELAMGKEAVEGAKGAANFLYGSSEERGIKFAESNAGLLAMSIMFVAKSLGVDSHPMSGIDFAGIKEQFNLNPDEDPVMIVTLGYHNSDKQIYPRSTRKGFDEIVEVL